tara:strand:+ start:531 stop:1514 length:984 start_codon:yes stop_codon:yes gene_type:complete
MVTIDNNLYIPSINAYIDPIKPVDKAIITHAHADHAKPNHKNVIATEDTLNIMKIRYGKECAKNFQPLKYDEKIKINDLEISLHSAGHILGSSQVLLNNKGYKTLITGDYKTIKDNSSQEFSLIKSNALITEATFGLPIFKHPHPKEEIYKLLSSIIKNNNCCHLVGCYALGKTQRIICLLREMGYDEEIFIHGASEKINNYYVEKGIRLGKLTKVNKENKKKLKGKIVLAPPSALKDKWSRGLPNVKLCMASGWMTVKQRAKQNNIELPLVISDHADWKELTETIKSNGSEKVWITHGREEGLEYHCKINNIKAKALYLKERNEED